MEKPVQILERETRVIRKKTIPVVKVLWSNQGIEEATWEAEEDMKKDYSDLF